MKSLGVEFVKEPRLGLPVARVRRSIVLLMLVLMLSLSLEFLPKAHSERLSAKRVLGLLTRQGSNPVARYVVVCWEQAAFEQLFQQYNHDTELDIHLIDESGQALAGSQEDWQVAVYRIGQRNRHCLEEAPLQSLLGEAPLPEWVYRQGDVLNYSLAQWFESHLNTFAVDSPEGKLLSSAASGSASGVRSCERVALGSISPARFFFRYVLQNRPVVVEAGEEILGRTFMSNWDLLSLVSRYGERPVSVRAVPVNKTGVGVFEGCESASGWRQRGYRLPERIREQLESPDKVLVRPAILKRPLEEVVKHIIASHKTNMSFYLEYFGLQELDAEFSRLSAPQNLDFLNFTSDYHSFEESRNLWLGDGQTIGKLHFDPQDNILVQVVGSKVFTLFEPHFNRELYEGHLREAQFVADSSETRLLRERFLLSTSMVNSPIDIENPNLTAYPMYEEVESKKITCRVGQGDILYMPAFYWHEVVSYQGKSFPRHNLAVNYWFSPFYTREFPCRSCGLKPNVFRYREVLREYADKNKSIHVS